MYSINEYFISIVTGHRLKMCCKLATFASESMKINNGLGLRFSYLLGIANPVSFNDAYNLKNNCLC